MVEKEATVPVRIKRALIPSAKKTVKECKNEFGVPKYDSITDLVSQAVEQLLRNELEPKRVVAQVPAR